MGYYITMQFKVLHMSSLHRITFFSIPRVVSNISPRYFRDMEDIPGSYLNVKILCLLQMSLAEKTTNSVLSVFSFSTPKGSSKFFSLYSQIDMGLNGA